MGSPGKLTVAVAAAVALALSAATLASAAIYTEYTPFVTNDGSQGGEYVECQAGDQLLGLGVANNSASNDFVYVNALYPLEAPSLRAQTYLDDYSGGLATVGANVYAVCDTSAGPGDYRFRSAGFQVPDDTERGRTQACGKDHSVVGGGVYSSASFAGEAEANSSGPVDLGDRDKVPDDGWRADVNNDEDPGGASEGGVVYAICDTEHNLRYRSASLSIADGALEEKLVGCPQDRQAIGGGVISHSAYRHGLYVSDTYPAVNDRWAARVHNWPTPDGEPRRMTVTSICL
jgi:hypothetical protein